MLFQENAYGMTLGLSCMNCTQLANLMEMLNQVTKYNSAVSMLTLWLGPLKRLLIKFPSCSHLLHIVA